MYTRLFFFVLKVKRKQCESQRTCAAFYPVGSFLPCPPKDEDQNRRSRSVNRSARALVPPWRLSSSSPLKQDAEDTRSARRR